MRLARNLRGHLTFHLKHELVCLEPLTRQFVKTGELGPLSGVLAKELPVFAEKPDLWQAVVNACEAFNNEST